MEIPVEFGLGTSCPTACSTNAEALCRVHPRAGTVNLRSGGEAANEKLAARVSKGYLPTLDGWRSVAITAVILCHAFSLE
jgi:hypothetical protein